MHLRAGLTFLLCLLLAPAPSALQWAEPFETPGRSSIERAHVDQFIRTFNLERDRIAIAYTLLEDFQSAMAAFDRDEVRPAMQRWSRILAPLEAHMQQLNDRSFAALEVIAAGGDTNEYRDLRPQIEAARERLNVQRRLREIELARLADRQAEMEQAFLDDLRAILTIDQGAGWFDYRDWLDRARYGGYESEFPEVNLRLDALLDEVAPTENEIVDPESLAATRAEYEAALASTLRLLVDRRVDAARHEVRRELERTAALRPVITYDEEGNVIAATPLDLVTAIGVELRAIEPLKAEQALRDVNRSFRARFATPLAPDAADRFRARVEEALHERWWNPEESKAFALARRIEQQNLFKPEEREVMQSWLEDLDRRRTELASRLLALSNEALDIRADYDTDSGWIDRLNQNRLRLQYEGLVLENRALDGLWNQLTTAQQARIEKPAPWPIVEIE